MNLSRSILAAAVGTIAFVAMTQTPSFAVEQEPGGRKSEAEIAAFGGAALSLHDAVNAAERWTNGKAIDAAFRIKDDKKTYKVKVPDGLTTVTEVSVDAVSGTVSPGESAQISKLDMEDRAEIAAFQNSKVSLNEAAEIAEKCAGGKAMDVALEKVNEHVYYEAYIVKNGAVKKIMVDPFVASKEVIPN